jgi:hypothetical protein
VLRPPDQRHGQHDLSGVGEIVGFRGWNEPGRLGSGRLGGLDRDHSAGRDDEAVLIGGRGGPQRWGPFRVGRPAGSSADRPLQPLPDPAGDYPAAPRTIEDGQWSTGCGEYRLPVSDLRPKPGVSHRDNDQQDKPLAPRHDPARGTPGKFRHLSSGKAPDTLCHNATSVRCGSESCGVPGSMATPIDPVSL